MSAPAGYVATEIGQLPEDWEITTLSQVCRQIVDGTHFTPTYTAHGVPFYSVENVTANDFTNVRFISQRDHEVQNKRCNPERGDILMTRIGSLADTRLIDWDVKASIYVSLALLKVGVGIDPRYLYAYSRSHAFRQSVENRSLMSAVPKKINMGAIGEVPVPIPPSIVEQTAIAQALSEIDDLIASLDALIAKKQDIKQSAMQQLLTGKRRLPGFSGEWQTKTVGEVTERYFCGPSPTCEERNVEADEWGVLKTTAITWESGWDWTKHKCLPRRYWDQPDIEIRAGDVIVTKAGPRHRVGVVAYVNQTPARLVVSGKMIALRPNRKRCIGFALAAAIGQRPAQEYLDQRTTGMAESQVNFENGVLLAAPVELPPLDEQIAIYECIEAMNAEIDAIKAKHAGLFAIRQGMIQQLLTGRIRLK